ncbi:PIR protein [Plasmodium yoelii]|uniref:PIR protein n=2 Tax=Plasmodium yoelii TaxID=5861 RepID=A0AAF0B6Q8_PLAYO|nr:PIR protein [Plasmodium yoelii]WBY59639.1 PIR protein [Plasmodium yoelii yoelii]VTZ80379.1 PIR protein [Plasmodium yoelii]|eukprot:XP_022810793.1 PIR protein [Plasmodium yoelii]
MNKKVCQKFENVWENFPDTLTNDKYNEFGNSNILNSYCDNNQCDTDIKKISAGFFYLLSGFFGDSNSFNFDEKSKNDVFYYIIIWISYMLNLKENELNNSLQYFYNVDISSQHKYTNPIAGFKEYNSYKDLLDKKKIVNMDIKSISKFYDAFKSLCNMYTKFNDSTSDCTKCLNDAKEFAKKYKELNDDSSITNDSSYNKLLCTLSNDYDNFKKKCKDNSSFPEINKPNITPKCPEQNLSSAVISEDVASSSSIANKLFTVLSIFGAIAFFLGISYKYSLFGFRKRFQKQKLREKIKKIKKKMNH